ncbi:MAG: hypothetical protein ABI411_17175 [Tahibacter sp.]
MSKYAEIAVRAAKRAQGGQRPRDAWASAALEVFPTQQPSRDKSCPRSSFLALADAGFLTNVQSSGEARKSTNGTYAIEAVKALCSNPQLAASPSGLWARTSGAPKCHNSQMDVVVALWQSGFLVDHQTD